MIRDHVCRDTHTHTRTYARTHAHIHAHTSLPPILQSKWLWVTDLHLRETTCLQCWCSYICLLLVAINIYCWLINQPAHFTGFSGGFCVCKGKEVFDRVALLASHTKNINIDSVNLPRLQDPPSWKPYLTSTQEGYITVTVLGRASMLYTTQLSLAQGYGKENHTSRLQFHWPFQHAWV